MKQATRQSTNTIGVIITIIVAAIIMVTVLRYAIINTSEANLRWWAGTITILLPLGIAAGFWAGHVEARGHVAGLHEGIDAVSRAANKATDVAQRAADIRVQATRQIAIQPQSPAPTIQQMFLPPSVSGQGGPAVILPPIQRNGSTDA